MNDPIRDWEDIVARYEESRRLDSLVEIGERRVAIDRIRRQVNGARTITPQSPLDFLLLLAQYARMLEIGDALAEADFVFSEAFEAADGRVLTREIVDALLAHGLLLTKMHNYDGAVAKLQEVVRRAEALEDITELDRRLILAKAWRGISQAFEALGELSKASAALDAFTDIKREIRYIVFSASRKQ